jgi:hypothetical protein
MENRKTTIEDIILLIMMLFLVSIIIYDFFHSRKLDTNKYINWCNFACIIYITLKQLKS